MPLLLYTAATRRRRAILPVPLSKDLESRLNDNPTAQDIRKIMLPVRQKVTPKFLRFQLFCCYRP